MPSLVKRLSGRFSKKDVTVKDLKELSLKTYREQAVWFMNAFWNSKGDGPAAGPVFKNNAKAAEMVWAYAAECIALDPKGEEGCEIDEVLAHRLLEKLESALTVVEMREVMRKVDVDFNKYCSLTEFLLYKFGVEWKTLVGAKLEQGEEMKEILDEAQAMLEAAQAALKECQEKAAAAARAENLAVAEEKKAEALELECTEKEVVFAEAEAKAQAAEDIENEEEAKVAAVVKELKDEEEAHATALTTLTATSKRESVGIVKRGKAKNELAQLQATETTGLRRARLNTEAALRRQKKATKIAAAARAKAQQARKPFLEAKKAAIAAREAATAATEKAKEARAEADAAVESSVLLFKEAQESLEAMKKEFAETGQGRFWWMDRELTEAKKYMSKKQLAALAKAGK